MVQPVCSHQVLDLPDGLLEAVSQILLAEHNDGPAGSLECFVATPVAVDLGIKKVMAAVVLYGEPPMPVTEIRGWAAGHVFSQRHLQLRLRKPRVLHREAE